MPSHRDVCLAFMIATLGSACDPYVRTTVVELRDPSLVHYATMLGQPIRPHATPVVVSDDDVRHQGNYFSEMIVTAQPAPDGSLVTSWQTDPDLFHRDQTITVRPAATTIFAGQDSVDTSQDTLSYPVCGIHHSRGVARNGEEQFQLHVGSDCSAKSDWRVIAQTPMSNVRSVRYESVADPGRSVVAALAVAMLAGGAASYLMLAPSGKNGEASAEAKTAGGVIIALGGAIDVGLLASAIFAHDHEEVVYAGAP